jgi:type I restriction enzyme S subunit
MVEKGYKKTTIGTIPEEWDLLSIPEIISKKNGMKIGPFGSQLKKELLVKNGFKVYGQENVYEKNIEIGNRYITKEHFESLKSCELRPKDFIISMMGTIGKCLIVPDNIQQGIMDSHLLRLHLNDKIIFADLLLHFFSSKPIIDQVFQLSVGGIMNGLSSTIIKKIQIPLPPSLEEQTAIATALSDTDILIENLEKLITKKRNIKQGAMQELLTGKKRLAGFNGDWESKPLREISYMKGRIGWQGLKETEFTMNAEEPFLITGMNFKDGNIKWDEVYHVSWERYEIAKEIQLKIGDVLMTKDGTIGKVLYVDIIPYPKVATLNSHLLVFRPLHKSYYPLFLYYQLSSKPFRDFIEFNKTGTTFFGISQELVSNYNVILPSLPEQEAISTIFSNMDFEIAALEQKLQKYRLIKQGMMQVLLTGKIRLI